MNEAASMKRSMIPALLLTLAVSAGSAAENDKAPGVLFVFDASGSMLRPVDGKPKDQVARGVMASVLQDLPADRRVGLVTFGHRRKKDCSDLEALVPIGGDRAAVARAIAGIKPKGETPLAEAIRLAAAQAKADGARDSIVVVSDGKDECGGDPCAAARELAAGGIAARIDVVGFDVGKADAEQLQCVASAGHGKYFSASNASQLAAALKEVERGMATASGPAPVRCPAPPRGSSKPVTCTCSAAATQDGSIWGTDVYTDDSSVCRAAVHAGVITAQGGKITTYPYAGQDVYEGGERNGIYSSSYGHFEGSFAFREGLALITGRCPGSLAQQPTDKPLTCDCTAAATQEGSVWGTDLYTLDSSLCRAALHAGVIKPAGGSVTVYPLPGAASYDGSLRNEVQTMDYGAYAQSFGFRADVAIPKVPRCSSDVFEAGKAVTCQCRAEDTQSGGVYGTDFYTGDSSVCRAALHAGVIPADGGTLKVTAGPGRPSYAASERNGVKSEAWGEYGASFSVAKVK
jgi:hypothetical protein